MKDKDQHLIFEAYSLVEEGQLALPGMKLPDEREGKINILTTQLVDLFKLLYSDKEELTRQVIDALKKSDLVNYMEHDEPIVVNKINALINR